jgi:SHS2 domain-containing protein
LEHPADLLLEIEGPDLAGLFENALFAFYDQTADLVGFRAKQELSIALEATPPADALRALLSEALYLLETEGFVAVAAEVNVETALPPPGGRTEAYDGAPDFGSVAVVARLWGETAVAGRHTLATEIKAVTYHRLTLERTPEGTYLATVLFDV